MTKTAKAESRIETVRNEADSAVKSLFRVVDKVQADTYVEGVRSGISSAAETVKDKAASLRTNAAGAVDVVAAGAGKGVEGLSGLGHHVVDATYANVSRTADMVKDLSAATSFGDVYRIETDYVRSILKQNYEQVASGFSILRNIVSTSVKAAQDQRGKVA